MSLDKYASNALVVATNDHVSVTRDLPREPDVATYPKFELCDPGRALTKKHERDGVAPPRCAHGFGPTDCKDRGRQRRQKRRNKLTKKSNTKMSITQSKLNIRRSSLRSVLV